MREAGVSSKVFRELASEVVLGWPMKATRNLQTELVDIRAGMTNHPNSQ